ncbi:CYTH and CHAD domain-containing protein [Streptomyces nodosus]|uniref:CHAD domain-containing protein n=1 Tax=Streptomyces nodosus TaxID=40318 RepID=A0A0B5DJQ4_9ACTN|nr:CYTH and CHAD domain-containing protein [Streptomyces nodosus]AJE40676.1 metal-binding protein [Streptomyces nodosus]MBB4791732.1 CHAD domain-containing protein [Streptomyces nodosus]QEV39228.1 CHAD domain-containing protein [Streptomyces nodosus]
MADTKREIERKYEAAAEDEPPDLTGTGGITAALDKGVTALDATYYDTADLRLTRASLTLRRRTGGDDAGWHLKLPVEEGVRDEIRAPLSDTVPEHLHGLVRSRTRDAALVPLVRLRTARAVHHLVDADGTLLAEVALDRVRAERLGGGTGTAAWTEIEVELADDGDPALLDTIDKKFRKTGLRPSSAPSKLARALTETGTGPATHGEEEQSPVTAGDHVLAYVRAQRDAIVALDPAVRRELPDSVHSLRVATRRLRSTFRTFGTVLDRGVTDPLADELKRLAAELGVDRDREVLTDHLTAALDELPRELLSGPVRNRLLTWSDARGGGSRRRLAALLDSRRHLDLLDGLDAVIAAPPLLGAAAGKPSKVITKAVRKDFRKVAALVGRALDLPPGHDRDVALHEARKKTKRTRYAAEAAVPVLGKRAAALVTSMKSLQTLLGDHQDSVMAREALRELSEQAHAAGESSFTYGVLYGREERRAAAGEAALPEVWRKAERRMRL